VAKVRLIARLDIKSECLVKGIRLEGIRKLGVPNEFALRYYTQGIDEILYIDNVASLYGRNSLLDIISAATSDVFVPMTVGGGLRSIEDVAMALAAGADKVAINTAAVANPQLISDVAGHFGSQCMVLSIQAKRLGPSKWEAYTHNGREVSGKDVIEWAQEGQRRGAGEILLTSVDQDGTGKGMDLDLIRHVSDAVSIPVIACGGLGNPQHLVSALAEGHCDAVAMGYALHYGKTSIADLRTAASAAGFPVRQVSSGQGNAQ
jgi:cyclase